ncbi:muramoyltetrapeptide carboxypeptidase [Friedmanniella luteola]|uniref:Muramoyltetrapeptide carboxypeptidase n=1 Tax=Friedmanniella luteola TaxID=546871 RepID=A0A1H1M081_9ACTN|nr:LD-carboxypeptidase [Friedmanniella luteola]SDR80216.1 muramoyltetrapeptide carboxypeptidase [Friedmanniella luteola]
MTGVDGLGPLVPGDRVALVAPAGPTPPEQLGRAEALLRSWGLEPVVFPGARASHPRAPYLAAEDAQRARDLEDAWCDATVAGVFALRGGYGSVRVLDRLDVQRMRAARPKPFYGSSDLTAVHEWLREQLGVASWFTPMVGTTSVLDDAEATASLRAAVLEGLAGRRWSARAASVLVPGTATGTLIGGNASLLAMTLGARRRPPLDHRGTIVLLEDVTEETYRIDGYLASLLRAGWFDGVVGIALGSWQACSPLPEIEALCRELLAPLGVPLVWELGFGHGPAAHSLPLGRRGTLVAEPGRPPELVMAPEPAGAAA